MSTKIMTERIYVAIGGCGWGKGLTEAEARRQARKHARKGSRLSVYLLPRGAYSAWVDDMGNLSWRMQPGATGDATLLVDHGRRIEQREAS